jgi:hypothetical protein
VRNFVTEVRLRGFLHPRQDHRANFLRSLDVVHSSAPSCRRRRRVELTKLLFSPLYFTLIAGFPCFSVTLNGQCFISFWTSGSESLRPINLLASNTVFWGFEWNAFLAASPILRLQDVSSASGSCEEARKETSGGWNLQSIVFSKAHPRRRDPIPLVIGDNLNVPSLVHCNTRIPENIISLPTQTTTKRLRYLRCSQVDPNNSSIPIPLRTGLSIILRCLFRIRSDRAQQNHRHKQEKQERRRTKDSRRLFTGRMTECPR